MYAVILNKNDSVQNLDFHFKSRFSIIKKNKSKVSIPLGRVYTKSRELSRSHAVAEPRKYLLFIVIDCLYQKL